jgi:uncharacterized membrane protein
MLAIAIAGYGSLMPLFWPGVAPLVIGLLGVSVSVGLLIDFEKGGVAAVVYGFAICIYGILGTRSAAEVLIHGCVGFAIILGIGKMSKVSRIDNLGRRATSSESTIQTDTRRTQDMNDTDRLEDYRQSSSVINRHFGVIITAIVSLAAVIVSYLQLNNNSINAKAQMDLEKLKNDRQFYFEVAKFLLDHEKDMASRDISKIQYLRNVVISAFPNDVAIQVSSRMRDTASTEEVKKVWEDGLIYLHKGAAANSQ